MRILKSVPKNVKGGHFGLFNIHPVAKYHKNFKKKSAGAEKTNGEPFSLVRFTVTLKKGITNIVQFSRPNGAI